MNQPRRGAPCCFIFIDCGPNAVLSSLRRLLKFRARAAPEKMGDRADASAEVDSVGGDEDAEDTAEEDAAEEDAVESGADGDDASHAGDEVGIHWS